MAGTLVKSVKLKITADDGDTEVKLDDITRKADELAAKHPELKVKIDTGAAAAKMAILRKELKDTGNQERDTGKESESLRGRLGALGAGFASLSGADFRGVGDMNMFQKVMLGLNVATGLGEPLMAGLTVAVGGLSSGLVSAGMGAGVFGLAAEGVVKRVTAADTAGKKLTGSLGQVQSGLKGATGEWNHFITAASPGVSGVIAQGLSLIPKALALMKPFLAPVESALHGIITEISHGLDSGGFKSFMGTMAKDSGPMLHDLAGAIGHIVVGIGGILKAFMPMAKEMMGGLDNITGKFAKWGTTLSGHSGFKSLMTMFKTETPLAMNALKSAGSIIKTFVEDTTGLSTFSNSKMLLQLADPILHFTAALAKAAPWLVRLVMYLAMTKEVGSKLKPMFQGIQSGIGIVKGASSAVQDMSSGFSNASAAASDASGKWGTFGGMVQSLGQKLGILKDTQAAAAAETDAATAATEEETVAQGELDGAMDANPIGLVVIAVAALALGIVELWKHSAAFRDFWKDAWKIIKDAALDAWHFLDKSVLHPIEDGIAHVVDWVKSHWKLLPAIFLGPLGIVVTLVLTHWQQISSMTSRLVGDVVRFFEGIPHFLARLPGELFSIGKNIVMGLVHGVESMFGAVGDAVKHLAGLIPDGIGKVLSIFSPSKVTHWHGEMAGQGLVDGMDSMHGPITAAAARMAKAAGLPGAGGYGGAGAGRPLQLELKVSVAPGSDAGLMEKLIHSLRYEVRVKGGQVQAVLGH